MMTFFVTFLIHACLMVSGYLGALIIGVKNKLEAWAIAYLLGSGLISVLFLLNHWWFGLALDGGNFLLAVATLIISALFILYRRQDLKLVQINLAFTKPTWFKKKLSFEGILSLMLLGIIAFSFLQNYFSPITDWDSLALYDFRAKVIDRTGELAEGIELGYFFQYPPYTSFLHAFSYLFDTDRAKVAYSMIYGSFLFSFYLLLKRKQKGWLAMLGTLILATDISIFEHATIAYNNLAYLGFYSLGIIYLWHWFLDANKKDLLLGSLLVGLSTLVRASEPFWLLAVLIIILKFVLERKQFRESLIALTIILLLYKVWGSFTKQLYLAHQYEAGLNKRGLVKVLIDQKLTWPVMVSGFKESTSYFWENVSAVINPFLPTLALGVLTDFYAKNKANLILFAFFIFLLLVIWGGTFIFSLYYQTWNQIAGSLQRVSMPLLSIICFLIFNSAIWKRTLHK